MAWNFLRYLANAARGASTVVPFAERSLLRADRSGVRITVDWLSGAVSQTPLAVQP